MTEIQLKKPLAKYIDHTLLKADATAAQIKTLCAEAAQYHFASVCVNSCYAKLARDCLLGSDVAVCCVVGFPLGAMVARAMAYEAQCAVEDGASEIDMVIPVGALKAGEDEIVRETIRAVVKAAAPRAIVKVIIEACLLTDEEKIRACKLGICQNLYWLFYRRRGGTRCATHATERQLCSTGQSRRWDP